MFCCTSLSATSLPADLPNLGRPCVCGCLHHRKVCVFKVLQVRYVSSHKRYDDRVSQSGIHAGACVMITA